MTISMKGGSGVDAMFEAVCGSPEDANTFAALLTAGLMYRKYQVGNTNPELGQLLDTRKSRPQATGSILKLSLTDDQMLTLIRKKYVRGDDVAAQPSRAHTPSVAPRISAPSFSGRSAVAPFKSQIMYWNSVSPLRRIFVGHAVCFSSHNK